MIQRWINQLWYRNYFICWLFWPLSLFYRLGALIKKRQDLNAQVEFDVPVIVIGNITVGGAGKTPLVMAIAKALMAKGYSIAIVSRGYKGQCQNFPHEINTNDTAHYVGDEPKLLAMNCGCPVVIDPQRNRAILSLTKKYKLDFIISDDGLQHYQMSRQLEISVIDGHRYLGNRLCLPAGPLREPVSRLNTVDINVVNGGTYPGALRMDMIPLQIKNLKTGARLKSLLDGEKVAAVAGMGHPERFFKTLAELNLDFVAYPFPDHYCFSAKDFNFPQTKIVMTEKDAVKCMSFATDDYYYVPIEAQLEPAFWDLFWTSIHELKNEKSKL